MKSKASFGEKISESQHPVPSLKEFDIPLVANIVLFFFFIFAMKHDHIKS